MNWTWMFLVAATFVVAASSYAQPAKTHRKVVVVYGDSITAGALLKNPEQRWASLVEKRSDGTMQVVNEGKGGRPTDSLHEFDEMLRRQSRADLLILALGANDARDISGRAVTTAVTNLRAMIIRARAKYGPAVQILLVAPTNIRTDSLGPTRPIAKERQANLVAMNTAFAELSRLESCAFVSTYGAVPDSTLTHDGVHPDAAGHEAIAGVLAPAITNALVAKARVDMPLVVMPLGPQETAAPVPGPLASGIQRPTPATEMPLWQGPAPGAPADALAEVTGPDGRTRNVSVPTLTSYLPESGRANGTAIIFCSGGAYTALNLKKYADIGTEAFLPSGLAVFNLKYRLRPPSTDIRADALADITRAVRLVRSRAAEWNIDPNRIGVAGASAGANLILNLMDTADAGRPDAAEPLERVSSRPNFALLLSTSTKELPIDKLRFSMATPIYMLHAEDDDTAHVELARAVEAAAVRAGVSVQAEYVPTGGHDAFGLVDGPRGAWTGRFLDWLERHGLLR